MATLIRYINICIRLKNFVSMVMNKLKKVNIIKLVECVNSSNAVMISLHLLSRVQNTRPFSPTFYYFLNLLNIILTSLQLRY